MLFASHHGQFWLSFARSPLAAGLLIRLFIIQHDCGYGSFFPSKLANDWVGRALGVLKRAAASGSSQALSPSSPP